MFSSKLIKLLAYCTFFFILFIFIDWTFLVLLCIGTTLPSFTYKNITILAKFNNKNSFTKPQNFLNTCKMELISKPYMVATLLLLAILSPSLQPTGMLSLLCFIIPLCPFKFTTKNNIYPYNISL